MFEERRLDPEEIKKEIVHYLQARKMTLASVVTRIGTKAREMREIARDLELEMNAEFRAIDQILCDLGLHQFMEEEQKEKSSSKT